MKVHLFRRTPVNRSPATFFLLVFALSIPAWLVGAVTGLQLLPGLPVSSLAAFSPSIAAAILVYKENKTAGVTELLKRSFDYKRIRAKAWYAPIILLVPGVMVLSYGLMRWMGTPVPAPQFPVLAPLVMFLVFFVAALGEELGWMGYAIDPIQERWNALQAGILLGLVWAVWHIVPFMQAHQTPDYIAWQCLNIVAGRVLFVWLYNNTGKSVFAAAVFHATQNVSWQLFPINGSYYDPRITALIFTFVVVIVTVVWGPKTLTRNRPAPSSTGMQSNTVV
jgi:membrane protease YdiL (CAAX protease family)